MKSISIKNPYAGLIRDNHKHLETRTWTISYRGPILILASKVSIPIKKVQAISGLAFTKHIMLVTPESGYILGKAIAVAEIVDCRRMRFDDMEGAMTIFHPDLYVHVYKNISPIEPFEYPGHLQYREVPDDVVKKIKIIP